MHTGHRRRSDRGRSRRSRAPGTYTLRAGMRQEQRRRHAYRSRSVSERPGSDRCGARPARPLQGCSAPGATAASERLPPRPSIDEDADQAVPGQESPSVTPDRAVPGRARPVGLAEAGERFACGVRDPSSLRSARRRQCDHGSVSSPRPARRLGDGSTRPAGSSPACGGASRQEPPGEQRADHAPPPRSPATRATSRTRTPRVRRRRARRRRGRAARSPAAPRRPTGRPRRAPGAGTFAGQLAVEEPVA